MVLILYGCSSAVTKQLNKDINTLDTCKSMRVNFGGIIEGTGVEEIVTQSFELVPSGISAFFLWLQLDEEHCGEDLILPPQCLGSSWIPLGKSIVLKVSLKVLLEILPPFSKTVCVCPRDVL